MTKEFTQQNTGARENPEHTRVPTQRKLPQRSLKGYDQANPVEEQHEEIISRPTFKHTCQTNDVNLILSCILNSYKHLFNCYPTVLQHQRDAFFSICLSRSVCLPVSISAKSVNAMPCFKVCTCFKVCEVLLQKVPCSWCVEYLYRKYLFQGVWDIIISTEKVPVSRCVKY